MGKIPVVMDCDPGVDDALAILIMHAAPGIEMKAITTVSGNQNVRQNTENALRIASFFNLSTPVAEGESAPLEKPFRPAPVWINGPTGLGGARLPPTEKRASPERAAEVLYRLAQKEAGRLQILATGPLTNIARLFMEYPDSKKMISRITIMGGSCGGGNATPFAEFNFYSDPLAAQLVLQSGVPITMAGMEVCDRTPLFESDFSEWKHMKTRASDFVCDLYSYSSGAALPPEGISVYDAIAAAAVAAPDAITGEPLRIRVETEDEVRQGSCLLKPGKPNVLYVRNVDAAQFRRVLHETLCFYSSEKSDKPAALGFDF